MTSKKVEALNPSFQSGDQAKDKTSGKEIDRREFLSKTSTAAAGVALVGSAAADLISAETTNGLSTPVPTSFDFARQDSLFHGHQWQTLNPGYWKIEHGALRRRLKNYGDRARRTGFPFHGETHGFKFKTQYDPSLESGIIYQPNWRLKGTYTVKATFTFRGPRPEPAPGDDPEWRMYQDGYGLMGIAIGGKSLYESYGKNINAWQAGWTDDGKIRLVKPGSRDKGSQSGTIGPYEHLGSKKDAFELSPGDKCELTVKVTPANENKSNVELTFSANGNSATLSSRLPALAGYVGIASRGLIDFEVNHFEVVPESNQPLQVGVSDCITCYPLGDTLKQVDGKWTVRFVGIFASDGRKVEIRVSDQESPSGGWESVAACGSAKIVNNDWRKNTSIIDVTLSFDPGQTAMYYKVIKDGKDVTADGRVGTDACGPGTGLVGDVPVTGDYVGRLPQLASPYKLCGLSCHAVISGLQQRGDNGWKRMAGGRDVWQFRDQPTTEAYKHLEQYNFQVMVWEDDVWYMELVFYPPSTDDAYKIIELSICGPASRWQMMRHWNVINPGDHDYGMDDVKGPEQIAIRKIDGLGQDASYMRRNFQIVHHLTTGAEEADPLENPKKWRAWKMPNRDFTFVILDSRLWRSSQDVDMWDDQGWNEFKSLYGRTDPTRSLLGEEQFGWLQELLSTDSSSVICLTGVNGMHTIWTGAKRGDSDSANHPKFFSERDRVTADYAGWVKAGADRVLELLGSRQGIVSVYGDVHNGCIMTNVDHRVIECSFGPIGRTGGRGLIPGFGPLMKDVDERDVEIHSLYHKEFKSPGQEGHAKGDPMYWNFLEMEFQTTGEAAATDPVIGMRIRNLVDAANDPPRGGGSLEIKCSQTGRVPSCKLPAIKTLPDAEVFITQTNGKPIRGARTSAAGELLINGLVDIEPGTRVLVNAIKGDQSQSQIVTTV